MNGNDMMSEIESRKKHSIQVTFSDLKPDFQVTEKQILELASVAVKYPGDLKIVDMKAS